MFKWLSDWKKRKHEQEDLIKRLDREIMIHKKNCFVANQYRLYDKLQFEKTILEILIKIKQGEQNNGKTEKH